MSIRVTFILAAVLVLAVAAMLTGEGHEGPPAEAGIAVPLTDSCVIKRVIDGDTFECEGGRRSECSRSMHQRRATVAAAGRQRRSRTSFCPSGGGSA
jgi:endonuclease YncB( thermonuclease family)